MKVNVLKVGVPTTTGRVFPRHVVEEAMDDIVKSDRVMIVSLGGGMKLSDACGHVTGLSIDEDGSLVAEVEFLENESGKLVSEIMSFGKSPVFHMSGVVKSAADGTVESLTLTGLDATFESNV